MKKLTIIAVLMATVLISHCQKKIKGDEAWLKDTTHTGKVLETFTSGGYTYMQIEERAYKVWVASPVITVTKGDKIIASNTMLMKDFESKTLGRVFDWILFASQVEVLETGEKTNQSTNIETDAKKHMQSGSNQIIKAGSIKKAPGGRTIAECYQMSEKLKNQTVIVSGVVVKYNQGILGKNWLHLKDGTGTAGKTDDITVTSSQNTSPGQKVTVKGKLALNRDFGGGYIYPVIIEDATLAIEK